MTKSVKIVILIIGSLTILVGIYSAYTGSEFSTYFPSIFLGMALLGTVYFSLGNDGNKQG